MVSLVIEISNKAKGERVMSTGSSPPKSLSKKKTAKKTPRKTAKKTPPSSLPSPLAIVGEEAMDLLRRIWKKLIVGAVVLIAVVLIYQNWERIRKAISSKTDVADAFFSPDSKGEKEVGPAEKKKQEKEPEGAPLAVGSKDNEILREILQRLARIEASRTRPAATVPPQVTTVPPRNAVVSDSAAAVPSARSTVSSQDADVRRPSQVIFRKPAPPIMRVEEELVHQARSLGLHPELRRQAVQALANYPYPRVAKWLAEKPLVQDPSPEVRKEAAKSLAKIGDRRSISALEAVAVNPKEYPDIREEARMAIAEIEERIGMSGSFSRPRTDMSVVVPLGSGPPNLELPSEPFASEPSAMEPEPPILGSSAPPCLVCPLK